METGRHLSHSLFALSLDPTKYERHHSVSKYGIPIGISSDHGDH